MSHGIFITFEGIDGAGKSTHIEGLAAAFRAQGRQVTLTREPGGTPLAEKLRTLVLNDGMDALTEALLIFAARRDHLQQVIEPALARGDVVQWVQRLPDPAGTTVRQPDLTVWFDLAPEIAAVRLAGARLPDRFEAQPVAFFEKVRAGYARRMAESPGRFARINADQPREAVWADVQAAVLTGRVAA
jgi:dTMP kinase